jgi:hypothetical protein
VKVKTNEEIKTLEGNPIFQNSLDLGGLLDAIKEIAPDIYNKFVLQESVKVKGLFVQALTAFKDGEDGMKKFEKGELARKIYNADEIDLDEKQIAILKECIGIQFSPLIVETLWNKLKV